ncbi:MAG TPA: hypothetical protein VIA18_10980, partial [Polyangia bacterium]|nr:hypothetical protein [Polyangia bacterium]
HSPDVSREIMGWLVLADGAQLAQQVAPDQPGANNQQLQAALLTQLGLQPDVATLIDLDRPLGIAMLNPTLLARDSVQPFVAMIPVRSPQAVEELLRAHGAPITKTEWGFTVPSGQAKMCFAFAHGYAILAWRPDLLEAAVHVLEPRLRARPEAPLTVQLDLDNVHEAYGPQFDGMLTQVGRVAGQGGASGDPQTAFALRGFRQLAQQLRSVSTVELLGNIDSGGMTLTVRAVGRKGSDFRGYVQQQQPGPAWGVQFLPRDSVMAFATHASPAARAADLAASVQLIGDVPARPSAQAPASDRDKVQEVMARAAGTTNGELAYAVWPGRVFGVGIGGAYRVNNAVAARAAVADVYATVAPKLGAMVMHALLFDADKLAKHVRVERRVVRFGDVEADLVDLSVAWPKGTEGERHLFESLFGKKLTMATAFVGDQALFTIGADFQERLAAMIATARGVPAASLTDEPDFAEALQYKQDSRVSLSYLETGRMARFAAGLVEQSGALDADEETQVAHLLATVGQGAIVSTTNASDGHFELTTHVPHSAIVGVASLNGALWRI